MPCRTWKCVPTAISGGVDISEVPRCHLLRQMSSNFVECESFLESNSPDILALCETNLDDSVDSGNFSVSGYLPLIRKDSITHMHGLAVCVKEGHPFARDLSLENLCF